MTSLGVQSHRQRAVPGWQEDAPQGRSLHAVTDQPSRPVEINLVYLLRLDGVLYADTCSAFAATWQLMADVAQDEQARAIAVRRRSGWIGVRPAIEHLPAAPADGSQVELVPPIPAAPADGSQVELVPLATAPPRVAPPQVELAPLAAASFANVHEAPEQGRFGETSALVLAGIDRDPLPPGFDVVGYTRNAVDHGFASLGDDHP